MIRTIGKIVLTPTHLLKQGVQLKKWLEVYPKSAAEIKWYENLDHSRTTHGEMEPHRTQSPLLIEFYYAKALALI